MYDELVKDLLEISGNRAIPVNMAETAKEATEAIEALICEVATEHNARLDAEERHRWIPVTERLPEEDGCYLVAVKNDHKRRYSKTAWFSHDSWFARQDVTHWMPLPQPPEEV